MSYTPESEALLLIRGILGVAANVRAVEESTVNRIVAALRVKASRAPQGTPVELSSAYTFAASLLDELVAELRRAEEFRYEAEPINQEPSTRNPPSNA